MVAREYTGEFVPSDLAAQLRAAGVEVAGVTATDDDGVVVAVQVVCEDGVKASAVDRVVAAYKPDDSVARDAKRLEIERALAASDWVVLRATETGKAVAKKWTEYRAALRDLHGEVDSARNPQTIKLPEPPK